MTLIHRIAIAPAVALTIFLAGCGAEPSQAGQAPAAAAVAPDRSKGPISATLSADGGAVAIVVPERTLDLSVADVFYQRGVKFDKAVIVAQSHQGDRYDVLLRLEAPSDPKQDGGRCGTGREVSMRHIGFDTGSTTMSSSNELESCLQRVRVVAERHGPGGKLDFDLKKTDADGRESPIFLSYDIADLRQSMSF